MSIAIGVVGGLLAGCLLTLLGLYVGKNWAAARKNGSTRKSLRDDRVTTLAQMLHLAIQASPTAVVVVDRHGDVVLSNTTAHELGVVHERQLNKIAWGAALNVFSDGESRHIDLTPQRPARRSRKRPVFSVSGTAQLLSRSDRRFVVIYAIDDSEKVRMESARRDFVANVSHELKTPVGAISLLVEALMESKDDPDAVTYFGSSLVKECRSMSQMISELISLSKLQGAEPLPDTKVLGVDDLIDASMERCAIAAEANGIDLSCDKPCGAQVKGDRSLLITAISNLITNAINYSPEATPVTVTREVVGSVVDIRVTDRGIGIAPEDQKRVFERFFRVDKARSRQTGGTGLGLAIVKHVAANHDGSIKLWSKLDTGSTFTLELPVYNPDVQAAPAGVIKPPKVPSAEDLDATVITIGDGDAVSSANTFEERK